MGGSSGGGAATPYEAPNSLSSGQVIRIVDVISEGVIDGFGNGNDAPLKSVYFNNTPVQNSDGTYNFKGVTVYFQLGQQDQAYVPGFDCSENSVSVGVEVKHVAPITRMVSDERVSSVRVTVSVNRNALVKDNGDTVAAETELYIELIGADKTVAQRVRFTEKSSGSYYEDVIFSDLPKVPFNIRVKRVTADSTSDKVSNQTYFASYVEIIDAKLTYPNSAYVAFEIDSDQFGNSLPTRNYLAKGVVLKVPSNYDPISRTYAGVWDGSFKSAWSNNPAWVFYDVLTHERYSSIAERVDYADIDKWSLYQIAQYCDELVDDGFGGKEPRFVFNGYITDAKSAGEVLRNLASVFRGHAVWTGASVSVMMDADADPVAVYGNSNVVDGLFTYSGAALKTIYTAAQVRYADKNNNFESATEFVQDTEAVARYGLNIQQVTAFGCDSRGQAARYGAWIIQTSLRQQNAVNFEVGREGLKHLPNDIIQIMDNDYAGAQMTGRLKAVSGKTLTLDRAVGDVVGALLYYGDGKTLKSAKVSASPSENQITLDKAVDMVAGDVWILSGKVKPRYYRAIEIKENQDKGTYTIGAVLHDPAKYADVDTWASFDRATTTLYTLEPSLGNAAMKTENGKVVLSWDSLTLNGGAVSYDIKIYKDNVLFRHIPDAAVAEIALENLPNGNYRAEIRGRSARGVLSEPLIKAWSINYEITGFKTTAKTLAIGLDWTYPQTVVNDLSTELWWSAENNIQTASRLTVLPYPQNSFVLSGVKVTERFYFWARIVDGNGNSGEFTAAIAGEADKNAAPIVEMLTGQLTSNAFAKSLHDEIMAMAADAGVEISKEALTKIEQAVSEIQAAEESRAKAVESVRTELNGQRAAVSETKQAVTTLGGKVQAMYTLKTETITGGRRVISGLAIGSGATPDESQVLVYANKFGIVNPNSQTLDTPFVVNNTAGAAKIVLKGDFIADGTIQGKHIVAGTSLSAPVINGGSLTIGGSAGTFSVANTGQVTIQASASKQGMKIFNDRIEVYDENGVLRVKLGKL